VRQQAQAFARLPRRFCFSFKRRVSSARIQAHAAEGGRLPSQERAALHVLHGVCRRPTSTELWPLDVELAVDRRQKSG
jgi:hypothetical protein